MSKRKKQNNNEPGEAGMYYSQRLCPICGKLIVASDSRSYHAAQSELGRRMKIHKQECQQKQAVKVI